MHGVISDTYVGNKFSFPFSFLLKVESLCASVRYKQWGWRWVVPLLIGRNGCLLCDFQASLSPYLLRLNQYQCLAANINIYRGSRKHGSFHSLLGRNSSNVVHPKNPPKEDSWERSHK